MAQLPALVLTVLMPADHPRLPVACNRGYSGVLTTLEKGGIHVNE